MEESRIAATTLSSGIAAGRAVLFAAGEAVAELSGLPPEERDNQKAVLMTAINFSVGELKELSSRISGELGRDKAEIFESHAEILEDGEFVQDFTDLIDSDGYSASFAVKMATDRHAAEMEELEDEYFRNRAEDFRDIGRRVIAHIERLLCGEGDDPSSGACARYPVSPSIIVSHSLSPGQTVQFYLPNVLGFVVGTGGTNSHAAILARSLGIPAVLAGEADVDRIPDGCALVLNLEAGVLIVSPCDAVLDTAAAAKEAELARRARRALLRDIPATTLCGARIGLYANGGGMKDLAPIVAANPDGIGLFRTEFLFMEQTAFPDESTQTAYYRRIIESMEGKPVIFRLLDIGGDKPLPYAPHPHENNPFLGWRGIRFLLDNPAILKTQLRSLLLASAATGQTVRIMVPMVADTGEMRAVKEHLEAEQKTAGGNAILGMMVETPAAALTVAAYRGLSSFISIGSNDLTQYTLAADRENGHLGNLYNELHPGVLALMQKACADAHAAGMETGICGEFAGRKEGALYLAAMGFDELSMSASAIAEVKELVTKITLAEARSLLSQALNLPDAASTGKLARDFLAAKDLL